MRSERSSNRKVLLNVMGVAVKTLLIGCSLVLAHVSAAQTKSAQSLGAKCHTSLSQVDRNYDFFANKSEDELESIKTTIENCLNDSYEGLTKHELAVAGIELEWVQYLIDQLPDEPKETGRANPQNGKGARFAVRN